MAVGNRSDRNEDPSSQGLVVVNGQWSMVYDYIMYNMSTPPPPLLEDTFLEYHLFDISELRLCEVAG